MIYQIRHSLPCKSHPTNASLNATKLFGRDKEFVLIFNLFSGWSIWKTHFPLLFHTYTCWHVQCTCIVIMRWLDLRKWQKLELSIALFDVWHLLSCNCLVWCPGCRGRPLGNPWDTSTPVGSPHVSDTTSLPYRKSWLNFRGEFVIYFFLYFLCGLS